MSFKAIEDRIRALEQQLQDGEQESFVDVDKDSSSEESEEETTQDRKEKEQKQWEEKRQEKQLLDKLKAAMAEDRGELALGEDEAYCEACCLKLSGDMDISVVLLHWRVT